MYLFCVNNRKHRIVVIKAKSLIILSYYRNMGSETSKNLKKVDIEIYFWYGGNGDVGHVSLYISESFLYISFWPERTTKGFKSVKSVTNTYAEDKR